jgi:dipeptidyl aminopeptidase/acylaminoacyl peptidase
MLVRVINWIFLFALLIGCAAPPTLTSTAVPSLTPAATLVSIDAQRATPTVITTPTPAAIAEEQTEGYLLAFATERNNVPGIYVTDLRGYSVHLITRQPMKADHPAWSPDGKRLAFTAQHGPHHELFVVDVDGTNLVQLTQNAGDNFYPTWSPDSQHIAFASNRDGEYQIYAMQSDGTQVRRLTDTTVREEKPAWSPDGSRIAFMSTRDGNAEVYVMNTHGSNPMRLTDHPASDLNPAWSPDGKLIAFNSTRGTGKFGIYVMNADGSKVRSLLVGAAWFEKPAWSPDGKQIAFYSNRDGNADVYVMEADGTNIQRITDGVAWDGQPAWSPQPMEAADLLACPVTAPNGRQPPNEKTISAQYHGNGALWTVLPADGILYVRRESDGWLSTKLPWWRGVTGTLTIEGRRLDGIGEFSAQVPEGYGDSGFQASGVYFSDEGCWEVLGRAGSDKLRFVVDVKAGE